jgi:hypothetical protein
MPKLLVNRPRLRRAAALAAGSALAVSGLAALPAAASANPSQVSMIEDGNDLFNANATLAQFRLLGANTVRVIVPWAVVAPDYSAKQKPNFNATDPNAYPSKNWLPFDNIVRAAQQDGLTVDLTISGGAPTWASGSGIPSAGHNPYFAWKPNAADYGQFVQAVGTRYSGHFKSGGVTLPRVHFWAIYNEPNFGQDLGPQAINGSRVSVAPMMFRNLLNAGWKALQSTGHRHDTILWGEFAARGNNFSPPRSFAPQGLPGNYGQTKPLIFIRSLYCLSSNYRPLRGGTARAMGCPTNAAGRRRFRANNPALFSASGVSDHPYPGNQSPLVDGRYDRNFAAFPDLGRFGAALDHANIVYGSGKHFAIYNTEYGYITNPPHKGYVSPNTAAWYINWAEYLSYKNGRVKSYMQYLLKDPSPTAGPYSGFASGLEFFSGRPKATFYAYRMPLYMPRSNISHKYVEVWGDVRPAPFASMDGFGTQRVSIQEKLGKSWKTINTARTRGGGYFDIHMKFATSGLVRTQWTYPNEPLLPAGYAGHSIVSRSFQVNVH